MSEKTTEFEQIKAHAEHGNASAQVNLGWMYQKGEGVTQNYTEAMHWYKKAAENGDAWAQFRLGDMYYCGRGVRKDYVEAVQWYTKAAEQGDVGAKRIVEYLTEKMENEK